VVSAALELGESVSLSVSVALVGSVVALSLSRGAATSSPPLWFSARKVMPPPTTSTIAPMQPSATSASAQVRWWPGPRLFGPAGPLGPDGPEGPLGPDGPPKWPVGAPAGCPP